MKFGFQPFSAKSRRSRVGDSFFPTLLLFGSELHLFLLASGSPRRVFTLLLNSFCDLCPSRVLPEQKPLLTAL